MVICMETTVTQRLNLMVDAFERGVKSAFAQRIGISQQGAHDLLGSRKGGPSFKVLTKILESYPQIRIEWLLLGEGEMLKDSVGLVEHKHATVGNLPLRPVSIQYTDKFYRDPLLKGNTPFETYKQGLPSTSALQEFADYFDTTLDGLASSLPLRKQKTPVQHELPAFVSQLKDWGSLVIPLGQHDAYIKQAIKEQIHAAKTQKGYACFELAAGSWVVGKLLSSSLDAAPDSLCIVVTHTTIFAAHVRPGSDKSPGDMMVYNLGSPPTYLLAADILKVWACEMVLSNQF
jgi:hypothetical protein